MITNPTLSNNKQQKTNNKHKQETIINNKQQQKTNNKHKLTTNNN